MQIAAFLEPLLNGLLTGAYYLVIALGLSLIFTLGGVVNLAQGAFYAIGAYLAVTLSAQLGFAGSLAVAPVLVGLLGVAIERLLHLRFQRADPILPLLLTFGLAMVAELGLRAAFGAAPLADTMPAALGGNIALGDVVYSAYRVVLLAAAVVVVTLTWLLIHRTPFGRVVRAGAQNPEMVGALGISLAPYRMAMAALGAGLAGLAGVLLAPIVTIHPAMELNLLAAAFVVVVIGGLGSFWRLVAAALLVGIAREFAASITPAAGEASMYLLMGLVLLFRPRGLFGERALRFG